MTSLVLDSPSKTGEYKFREPVISNLPDVFTKIYDEQVNIAIWQQGFSAALLDSAQSLIRQQPNFKAVMVVTPDETPTHLAEHLQGIEGKSELCRHVSLLVDMFCTLFDLKNVGLRLTVLEHPMCPKFHVDKIPCRLVTTFIGQGTQWLTNQAVNRTKLGASSHGLTDEESGIYQDHKDIKQLSVGDVALLKGESWFNNTGGGLVHRSPFVGKNERRLLLTLDFMD